MKKLMILAVLLGFAAAYVAQADTTTTVTNRGQVITVKTYGNMVTDTKNLDIYQDVSKYATKVGEEGQIVRWYDFDKQGTASLVKLVPEVPVPHGALITDGFVYSLTALTPARECSNSLGVVSTTDLKAVGTNFSDGVSLVATVPVGTVATTVAVPSNCYVRMTVSDSALTAGKYMVVLKYTQGP